MTKENQHNWAKNSETSSALSSELSQANSNDHRIIDEITKSLDLATIADNAAKQYQQSIQFALQSPKFGPNQWPGGCHPQHTHALTYSKIFVGGLKRETTRQQLNRYFSKFGPIRKIDVVMDPRNPTRNRGFAFIQFEYIEACEEACRFGQFHNMFGQDVEVKRAVLKPPGSGSETAGIDPTSYQCPVAKQEWNYYQGTDNVASPLGYYDPYSGCFYPAQQNYLPMYEPSPVYEQQVGLDAHQEQEVEQLAQEIMYGFCMNMAEQQIEQA